LLCYHLIELRELAGEPFQFVDQPGENRSLFVGKRKAVEPLPARLAEQMSFVLPDEVGMQDRVNAPLNADDLFKHAHALGGLTAPSQGIFVGDPDLRQIA
jgi:hypothetical protein